MKIVLDLHYFPCVEYFTILAHASEVLVEACEHFQKQSYRNRCYIRGANKIDRLTVPVYEANSGRPLQQMRIDPATPWQAKHLRALQSAYGKSPFFEHYAPFVEQLLRRPQEGLLSLDWEALTLCHRLLGLGCHIGLTSDYRADYGPEYVDLRGQLHPKRENGIISVQPYVQVFEGFEPNLSVLDLLFCEGPASGALLRRQYSSRLPTGG